MTAVVEAESLTKRFGEVSAVTDLSFALEAGTITGFLGPNGAGKTTTLRMILGLVAPSSGRARVFDLVSPGAGAITLIAWAGALGVLGIALTVRQDLN
jgi:ABC-type multidrug transport system ATPase subunit